MLALHATAAPAATTTRFTEQAAGTVAAYDGTVVWSSYDAAAKDYRLVLSKDGGAPAALPVAPRATPFDVDLGRNANGSTYAVYTRCGPGCDIYCLSLATGVETHLTQFSSPTADEREPTIQAGRIAFLRRDKSGGRTYDYLRMGFPRATGTKYLGVKLHVTKFDSLAAPELSSTRIAYTGISEGIGFGENDGHVRTLSGSRDTKVYVARSGGANSAQVTRPSLTRTARRSCERAPTTARGPATGSSATRSPAADSATRSARARGSRRAGRARGSAPRPSSTAPGPGRASTTSTTRPT
jgi:hypothetical protein